MIDFTRSEYDKNAGIENAIKYKNFVKRNSSEDAEWFSKNYKNFYPVYKKYLTK